MEGGLPLKKKKGKEKMETIVVSIANTFAVQNLAGQIILTVEGETLEQALSNLFFAYEDEPNALWGHDLTGWGMCIEYLGTGEEVFLRIKSHDELQTAFHYWLAEGCITLADFFAYAFASTEYSEEAYKKLTEGV